MVFIIISVLWDCNNFNPLFQLSESQAINQRGTAGSICRLFRRVFDAHMTFCNTDTWQHVDLKPTTKHAQAWVRMKERMNVADVSWITECLAGRHSVCGDEGGITSCIDENAIYPGSLQANKKKYSTIPMIQTPSVQSQTLPWGSAPKHLNLHRSDEFPALWTQIKSKEIMSQTGILIIFYVVMYFETFN